MTVLMDNSGALLEEDAALCTDVTTTQVTSAQDILLDANV